jgi:acetyl-CoA synthetase
LAIPKAYVALAADWPADAETARTIMEFVRDRVAPHLRVRRLEFYELPKTISGKIRRVDLRRREQGAYVAGTPSSAEYRYEDLVG